MVNVNTSDEKCVICRRVNECDPTWRLPFVNGVPGMYCPRCRPGLGLRCAIAGCAAEVGRGSGPWGFAPPDHSDPDRYKLACGEHATA